MNWTPMSKAAFEQHVARLEADEETGILSKASVMLELLDELLTAGQDWADQAFIDVVEGAYGTESRHAAAIAIEDGFRDSGATVSFVRMCIRHGKMPLLHRVADLAMPEEVKQSADKHYVHASTEGGRWLDLLANVNANPRTSFAYQVRAFSTSATGTELADILVRHDPDHGDIELMRGSAGHGIVMQALMLRHIGKVPAEAAADVDGTSATRRQRRHGL